MYKNRDPSTLWWMVSAHNLLSQKRVVRTWLSRRTRAAFQQALRDYGFDSQGKRLAPPFIRKPGSRGCVNDLTGTVEITLNPRMHGGDLSGLDSDMAVTLKTILRHRKGKGRPAVAEGEAVAGGEAVVEKGHLLGVQQS
ncbi:uncharacterized protein KD926_011110 [Aspergillus affinis]|uniref:uncharacterized protein n=1 Tax=Aspergillus affinis TaxID=1070780 RepID=UPI0022FE45C7|nr:uncharacterized protein KD926_011110 [Aspergillus affinis]KAI9044937.1 hypothetical protein KD926_011110 [Aspergillus affinis]